MDDQITSSSEPPGPDSRPAGAAPGKLKHALKRPRLIRYNAILMSLPEAVQEELYLDFHRKEAKAGLKWLWETHQVNTGRATLIRFFRWFRVSHTLEDVQFEADLIKEALRKSPRLREDAALAAEIAQIFFEHKASTDQRTEDFIKLRELRLVEQATLRRETWEKHKIELARRRLDLAEKKAAPAPKTKLTPEERERKIKDIFGIK